MATQHGLEEDTRIQSIRGLAAVAALLSLPGISFIALGQDSAFDPTSLAVLKASRGIAEAYPYLNVYALCMRRMFTQTIPLQ